MQYGRFFTDADYDAHANVVVLGPTVVKNLLGEQADVSSVVGRSIKIGGKTFSIIGVFKTKGSNGFADQDNLAVMPLTTIRDTLSGNTGTVDGLTVQASSASATTAAQSEVTSILLAQHKGASQSDYLVLNQASLLVHSSAEQSHLHRVARRRRRHLACSSAASA